MRRVIGPVSSGALASVVLACVNPNPAAAVEEVRPTLIGSRPHDPQAFTQGLLLHQGSLFESTGLYGESSLREVSPETGEVLRSIRLADDEFGEGLARVGERLLQLTWRNGVAHEYSVANFERLRSFEYEGEGWGLCHDGERLVMSDGSSNLFFRDAQSFELTGSIGVTLDGAPMERLNELECVEGLVYANVWQTDWILRIDPETGEVLTRIDAAGLLTAEERQGADVLNGIAYDPATGHFLITGKLWPRLFEVSFDSDASSPDASSPDANLPDASLPDARAPDTHEPDASVTDASAADVSASGGGSRDGASRDGASSDGPPRDGATDEGAPGEDSTPTGATLDGSAAVGAGSPHLDATASDAVPDVSDAGVNPEPSDTSRDAGTSAAAGSPPSTASPSCGCVLAGQRRDGRDHSAAWAFPLVYLVARRRSLGSFGAGRSASVVRGARPRRTAAS